MIKEKWIEVRLSIMAYAHTTIDIRKTLKEYAEELGWDFKEEKKGIIDELGSKLYHMWIEPKGGKISPEEFGEEIQRIHGFTETLSYGMPSNYDEEGNRMLTIEMGFVDDLMEISKREDFKMLLRYAGFLHMEYPLIKRIQLEDVNKDLALTIFNNDTFQESFDKMEHLKTTMTERLFKTDVYNRKKKVLDKIRRWFNVE